MKMDRLKKALKREPAKNEADFRTDAVVDDGEDVGFIAENVRERISTPLVSTQLQKEKVQKD